MNQIALLFIIIIEMKEVKVEEVLFGYDSVKLKINNKPFRIIPMIIEDENKVFQLAQILKSYQTFRNEKNNIYTEKYMSTIYGLLFRNERRYHIKRNKLSIHLPELIEDENALIKLPLTQPNKYNKSIQITIPPINSQEVSQAKTINQKSFEKTSSPLMKLRTSNQGIGNKNNPNARFRNLSVEKSRLLEMIYTSNEFFKQKVMTKQERLNRRINYYYQNTSPNHLHSQEIKSDCNNPPNTTINAMNKKPKIYINKLSKKLKP